MSVAKKNPAIWNIENLSEYISEIVSKESGNVLGASQQSMVQTRVQKRLLDLGDLSPADYYNYITDNYKEETGHLVSMLTTHHTFFFREFSHFEFILENLGGLVEEAKKRGDNTIKILSAACSRGHEVYSLAMFLNHHLKSFPGIKYKIHGTDIDPESVKIATNGVYKYSEVKSIPQLYLGGNWQRGTGDIAHYAKVKKHIKDNCSFASGNLLDLNSALAGQKFDIIFCRNVFIYFDAETITKIVSNTKKYLHEHGYYITGLSESLKSIDLEIDTLTASVYRLYPVAKPVAEKVGTTKIATATGPAPKTAASIIPKPIRLLVVDDSQSVLKLLGKIFDKDPDFEVVGTACNGIEAEEFLKKNPVDAMTLDIHMPEMDGVEYLKKNFKPGHPHVVVISSASREDTRYAQQTLANGASDFIEKPTLNNLKDRAEEIKNKLKMAFYNNTASNSAKSSSLDQSFKADFEIKNTEDKARMIFANFSDVKKVSSTLSELKGKQPACFIFFEGNFNFLEMIKEEFSGVSNLVVYEKGMSTSVDKVYLCDSSEHLPEITKAHQAKKVSLNIYGICSSKTADHIVSFEKAQVLLEDIPDLNSDLKEIATDIFPWTSFSHLGTEYLAKDES